METNVFEPGLFERFVLAIENIGACVNTISTDLKDLSKAFKDFVHESHKKEEAALAFCPRCRECCSKPSLTALISQTRSLHQSPLLRQKASELADPSQNAASWCTKHAPSKTQSTSALDEVEKTIMTGPEEVEEDVSLEAEEFESEEVDETDGLFQDLQPQKVQEATSSEHDAKEREEKWRQVSRPLPSSLSNVHVNEHLRKNRFNSEKEFNAMRKKLKNEKKRNESMMSHISSIESKIDFLLSNGSAPTTSAPPSAPNSAVENSGSIQISHQPASKERVNLGNDWFCSSTAWVFMNTTANICDWCAALLKGTFGEEAKMYRVNPRIGTFKKFPETFIRIAKVHFKAFIERRIFELSQQTSDDLEAQRNLQQFMAKKDQLIKQLPALLSDGAYTIYKVPQSHDRRVDMEDVIEVPKKRSKFSSQEPSVPVLLEILEKQRLSAAERDEEEVTYCSL